MKPILILACAVILMNNLSNAQTIVNSTGSTISNNQFVVEYSIGEVAINTLSITGKDFTQGLLQPQVKIANPDCNIISAEIKYFENPTEEKLRLVGINNWIHSYQVFASDGRLVKQQNFYNNHLDISGLPAAGIYFIRLLPGCNGKFKVIKFMKR